MDVRRLIAIGFAVGSIFAVCTAALVDVDGFLRGNWVGACIFGGGAIYIYDRLRGARAWIGSTYSDINSSTGGRFFNDVIALVISMLGLMYAFGFR